MEEREQHVQKLGCFGWHHASCLFTGVPRFHHSEAAARRRLQPNPALPSMPSQGQVFGPRRWEPALLEGAWLSLSGNLRCIDMYCTLHHDPSQSFAHPHWIAGRAEEA